MKILVTGGAGYLGSVLVDKLLYLHEVTVVDTFEHGCLSLAHLLRHRRLKIIREAVAIKHVDNMDAAIHLAAVVGAPACDNRQIDASMINHRLTSAIANEARNRKMRLIYPCTNSGYGVGGEAECDEDSPLNPISLYGRTKVAGEKRVLEAGGISLRLATLFGWSPRMRRDLLVNDLVWRAVKDRSAIIFEGAFRRNFCHVRDAANAFIHALNNYDSMRGQAYNVGDTRANMTKIALCDKIREHVVGFQVIPATIGEDPDKRDYVVSNAKFEATGWRPEISLDDGIDELVRGYAMCKREELGNV